MADVPTALQMQGQLLPLQAGQTWQLIADVHQEIADIRQGSRPTAWVEDDVQRAEELALADGVLEKQPSLLCPPYQLAVKVHCAAALPLPVR